MEAEMKSLQRQLVWLNMDRLVVIILLIALFAMAARTPADTDMWWHLAAGRATVTTGRIPSVDEFSFTARGRPWIDVQWLAQVGLYALYCVGGHAALAILVAALVVVAFAFVYAQMAGSPFLRAFIIVLAAAASSIIWSPRPQMLSFAFLGVTSYVVYLCKWKQINRLWVLIPLFVLWANVHGGYALGLMLIGSVIAGEALNRLTGRAELPEVMTWREIGLLIGVGVACGLALLINPYGLGTWTLPFRTVGIKTLQGFILEWASPDFHNLYEQPVLWLLMALLVLAGFSRRRWDWSELVITVVFGYSAFLARRNIAPLALVIAPVLSRQAWPVVELVLARIKLPVSARQELDPALSAALNALIVLLVIALALAQCVVRLSPRVISQAQRLAAPVRAVEWLERVERRPAGPMVNSYNWGGYLVWALPGRAATAT